MRKPVAMLVIAIFLTTPLAASDFSELARPDFARTLLMSQQQREEMVCADGWISTSTDRPLAPLIAEMDDRHAIALGSRRFTEKRGPTLGEDIINIELDEADTAARPQPSLEEAKKSRLAELPLRCAELASAYAKGGMSAARPLLAPRPSVVIALPPTGTCLRQLETGRIARDDDHMAESIRDIRRELKHSNLVTDAEKATIERDYAAFVPPALSPARPDQEWSGNELQDLICFPVLAQLSSRLRGEE